jgi:hypothetical protein
MSKKLLNKNNEAKFVHKEMPSECMGNEVIINYVAQYICILYLFSSLN